MIATVAGPLLPQQIAPVDRRQAELTRQYFDGRLEQIYPYFLALRTQVDAELATKLPLAGGKPYPYGRCEEITRACFKRLAARMRGPSGPTENAIRDFARNGGIVRTVWGVLRGQYFQNALQFGALYVDVANDTVVVTKPTVEILPMAESGLVALRDLDHFREIAAIYWKAAVWANVLVPSLAPLLPLVTVNPGPVVPQLQAASDYMIALMCRDGFRQAEAWLHTGPTPPPEVAAAVLATLPQALSPQTADGRGEAIEACRAARAAGHDENGRWRSERVMDFLSLRKPQASRGQSTER
ncbi:MAG: hypothetical protein GC191_16160 [Azospirillum sp.]|nr:hypothetical protein [Azospirillum sp.]